MKVASTHQCMNVADFVVREWKPFNLGFERTQVSECIDRTAGNSHFYMRSSFCP